MDGDLRAELDKLWDKLDLITKGQGGLETRMGVADQARAEAARQMAMLAADIRQINVTLTEIAVTLAAARGGLWIGRMIGLALAAVIGWASAFTHIGLR
jgi:hypothetical protein